MRVSTPSLAILKPQVCRSMCACTGKPSLARTLSRSTIFWKPSIEIGALRSDMNRCVDAPVSRCIRRKARSSRPVRGCVAGVPVQACDKPTGDRVLPAEEDNRNLPGRPLGRACRRGIHGNHSYLTTCKIGSHPREPIVLTLRPTVFDRDVLALDIARFLKSLEEASYVQLVPLWRCTIKEPDHRYRRLLRAGGQRPPNRSAEQRDELPPVAVGTHALARL